MIRYAQDGALGRMVLSNPPANALARPDFTSRADLTAFLARPELKGVVVVGEGRHFCGGADKEALAQARRDLPALGRALEEGQRLLEALASATVPVVAAVRGQCLGGGLELALACHFRVAGTGSMLGFPEAALGLLPGLGGTAPAGARPSRQALVDLTLSARLVGAEEALALGLVDRLVPTAQVEAAAEALIHALTAERTPRQVRAILEALWAGQHLPRAQALERETALFLSLARGEP